MNLFLRYHVHAYAYFGGVTTRTMYDNMKTSVVKHLKDGESDMTDEYAAFVSHYTTSMMPSGVHKQKQKASVERAVEKSPRQLL